MNERTVIVTGGRRRADWQTIWEHLDDRAVNCGGTLTVRHGDHRTGADKHAKNWCEDFAAWYEQRGITILEDPHPADWATHGKPAGMIRNGDMVRFGADEVLAYPDPDSVGTYGCVDLAVRAGIPTRIYRLPNDPPKAVHRQRTAGWRKTPAAVIVTRPGRWGNPFTVEQAGSPAAAVDRFRRYLDARRNPHPGWVDVVGYPSDDEIRRVLAGRDLACYCPLPAAGELDVCHRAVLLEIANGGSRG